MKEWLYNSIVIFYFFYLLSFEFIECNKAFTTNKIYDHILSGEAPTTNKHSLITEKVSYNSKIRPNGVIDSNTNIDENGALKLHISLLPRRIVGFDERNMMLTTFVMLMVRWNDPRLSWNSTMYDDITELNLPASSFWLPDLAILNMADVVSNIITYNSYQNVLINSDGTVYLTIGMPKLITRCNMNVYKYPFDRQTW